MRSLLILVLVSLAGLAWTADTPLADAVIGEWSLYTMTGGMEQKQTVTAVDDAQVTVRMVTMMSGEELNTTDTKLPKSTPAQPEDEETAPHKREATMTIGERELTCTVTTMDHSGVVTETWTCPEVPITGVVKVISDGETVMTLKDFGIESEANE